MEQEADMMVDSLGTPFAAGGLNLSLRDAARFGQLMLQQGVWNGKQIVPREAVAAVASGGDRLKFSEAGYKTLPEVAMGVNGGPFTMRTEPTVRAVFTGRHLHRPYG